MKKVNTAEMREVNAGAKLTVTAKCSVCGKKYKSTLTYYKWIPFHKAYVKNLATIQAYDKAKECANNDAMKW